jgi:hypothetical protein
MKFRLSIEGEEFHHYKRSMYYWLHACMYITIYIYIYSERERDLPTTCHAGTEGE